MIFQIVYIFAAFVTCTFVSSSDPTSQKHLFFVHKFRNLNKSDTATRCSSQLHILLSFHFFPSTCSLGSSICQDGLWFNFYTDDNIFSWPFTPHPPILKCLLAYTGFPFHLHELIPYHSQSTHYIIHTHCWVFYPWAAQHLSSMGASLLHEKKHKNVGTH